MKHARTKRNEARTREAKYNTQARGMHGVQRTLFMVVKRVYFSLSRFHRRRPCVNWLRWSTKRDLHLEMETRVPVFIFRLSEAIWLANSLKNTGIYVWGKICLQFLMPFYLIDRTGTAAKGTDMKNPRAKSAKLHCLPS